MKNVFILFFALLMFSCEDVELEQKTENVSDDYGLIVDVAEDFANKMQNESSYERAKLQCFCR